MTPSKALFFFCVSFAAGVALESLVKIPMVVLWGFFIAAAACISAGFFTKKPVAIFGFCLLFLVLGISRMQIAEFAVTSDKLSKLNDVPGKITLQGKIIAEPDIRVSQQKLTVRVDESLVLVTMNRYPEYHYLDTVQIVGKLKNPPVFETFNYKNYLAKDGIYSVMDFPAITVTSARHQYTLFLFTYEKILSAKTALVASLNRYFSGPDAPILEGVIFGNDKNMSAQLKNAFNVTGLSHVTAVSGTNIVILINVLMVFLLAVGFWRGQAFWVAIILIWLYIIMIGFPVSGVRAAIMGCIALLAQKLGRQNTSSRVLTMAGALMLMQNPMLLFYDVSFQLSFLASLGIIYIKPLIDYYFSIISWEKIQWLLGILSVTFAAQIITLPVIVYNFGTVSLVAPLTNILILPLVEILTVLGFLTALAGMFWHLAGILFSLPCLAMLWYFVKVLDVFSAPWAVRTINNVSWIWVAGYYAALIIFIWWLRKHQKSKASFY